MLTGTRDACFPAVGRPAKRVKSGLFGGLLAYALPDAYATPSYSSLGVGRRPHREMCALTAADQEVLRNVSTVMYHTMA